MRNQALKEKVKQTRERAAKLLNRAKEVRERGRRIREQFPVSDDKIEEFLNQDADSNSHKAAAVKKIDELKASLPNPKFVTAKKDGPQSGASHRGKNWQAI